MFGTFFLGIGEGTLEIKLDQSKVLFTPGETINGQIILTLTEPKKAKSLLACFYGEVSEKRYGPNNQTTTTTRKIEYTEVKISEQKEYPKGQSTYKFAITVPQIAISGNSYSPSAGILGNLVNNLIDPIRTAKWYLACKLDVEMAFDMNKHIQLNILR